MPTLDLSDSLLEPTFLDRFLVKRRAETVNQYGESTTVITQIYAYGTVDAASPNDLDRGADEQHQGKSIAIVTRFRLRGVSAGYQPDLVVWHGDSFVVAKVEDYTGYGAGWVQVECRSIDFVDEPPSAAAGALIFTLPSNSAFMGAV